MPPQRCSIEGASASKTSRPHAWPWRALPKGRWERERRVFDLGPADSASTGSEGRHGSFELDGGLFRRVAIPATALEETPTDRVRRRIACNHPAVPANVCAQTFTNRSNEIVASLVWELIEDLLGLGHVDRVAE